jgi:single-strand DNA-binding protein
VQIIGNLGRDPELRFTQSGTPVCNFTIAVNDSWQNRDGEQREHTEWFRIVAWARLAEIANEYLRRGRQVYVEGRLQTREWQDREGNDRTTTELVARDLMMLGGRESESESSPQSSARNSEASGQSDEITADDLPF